MVRPVERLSLHKDDLIHLHSCTLQSVSGFFTKKEGLDS